MSLKALQDQSVGVVGRHKRIHRHGQGTPLVTDQYPPLGVGVEGSEKVLVSSFEMKPHDVGWTSFSTCKIGYSLGGKSERRGPDLTPIHVMWTSRVPRGKNSFS